MTDLDVLTFLRKGMSWNNKLFMERTELLLLFKELGSKIWMEIFKLTQNVETLS